MPQPEGHALDRPREETRGQPFPKRRRSRASDVPAGQILATPTGFAAHQYRWDPGDPARKDQSFRAWHLQGAERTAGQPVSDSAIAARPRRVSEAERRAGTAWYQD